MGFLDMFDSPDIMGSLLGIGSSGANQSGLSQIPALSATLANGTPAQAATQAVGATPMQIASGQSPNAGNQMDIPGVGTVNVPPGAAGMGGAPPPQTEAPPPQSGAPMVPPQGRPGGPLNVPLPVPRANSQMPPPPQAPMAPQGGLPMPPPAALNGPGARTITSGGGLGGALGVQPPQGPEPMMQPSQWQNFIGGLGKGLSAVGGMPRGATAGQAFAAGMGGGIQGAQAQQIQQITALRAMRAQNFNMSSMAFRDMLAAQQADNSEAFNKARANYFNSRAQLAQLGGGSNAYQNSPFWKTMKIEDMGNKLYHDGMMALIKGGNATPEAMDELRKQTDGYKAGLYKQFNINPQDAEKYQTMGLTPKNPFDTKGMTMDQFNTEVPMYGWYKDENGTVRQRLVGPPAGTSAPQASFANPAGGNGGTQMDDYVASMPAEQAQLPNDQIPVQ